MITKPLLVLKNRKVCLFVALTYTIVLLYFSLGDADAVLPETNIKFQDKILHFVAYLGLSVLWGYYALLFNTKNAILYSFIATLIFGIILELVQEAINPLRNYDILDLVANCIGVLVGTIVVVYYVRKLKLKS
ncbi:MULTISPECIES: VanZ family protein [unclassified Winogradskyella]|uniref:VanZ family protein n=1 Tax=unclassified Winogradskyella TaxID=2615021 RepID=UPI0018E03B6B|nr:MULTISPECIES: VanZ family protein [unclassified Winogradskyella]